ncbi:MAG: bifunctional 4-hydroxy-3-methylbut-2-enyl diphosphate reductase/30S ribosomal protein S1 [Veillonellales bacterium]
MKILLAEHRGFCYGVKRAVEMARNCIGCEGKYYTLGPIIHNPQFVKKLEEQGIRAVKDVAEVSDGTIIIRSHGVGPQVYAAAEKKGIKIIDATCPHVKKAQQAALQLLKDGYTVVVVGEAYHPEVKSIVAWTHNQVLVVETPKQAQALSCYSRLGVVSQTTFAGKLFTEITAILKTKTEELKIDKTICTATEIRQQSAVRLASKVDAMIVVGGKNSANTSRLVDLCRQAGGKVFPIETAEELDQQDFQGVNMVGITAGASTPDWIIEEVYRKMTEFDQILKQDITKLEAGMVVKGTIVNVRQDEIFVDIGYKGEGVIPLAELAYPIPENAADIVSVGQTIDVLVEDADSTEGIIKLSKVKAEEIAVWEKLAAALEKQQPIEGKVLEVIKGGLLVAVFDQRAFVPASHVELRFVEDLSSFVGQKLEFIPLEIDQDKKRIVLSRKLLLQEQRQQREAEVYATLTEKQIIKGIVRRITNFGAFIDIGGVDGLVHISDMSWQRVKSPSDVVSVGDEVTVQVLKVDPEKKRISLSLKYAERDPWLDKIEQFAVGMIVTGKVSKTAKFGAFVEICPGVEGLVHLSELADHRVTNTEEVVKAGQEVKVKITDIDKSNKRIGLSISQAQQDAERSEFQSYLDDHHEIHVTLGEKFGHLFKRED